MPINTHDLHTEVDWQSTSSRDGRENFNSRPPHGGRQVVVMANVFDVALQLTTSTRRSTAEKENTQTTQGGTSTHDLHTEVDIPEYIQALEEAVLQLTTSTRRSTLLERQKAQ